MTFAPHQQRVIDEKNELDVRRGNLHLFLDSPIFKSLDQAEQERLTKQYSIMNSLSEILSERIAHFQKSSYSTYEDRPVSSMNNVVEISPELAGQPLYKNDVIAGDKPIDDIDTFAMIIDHWHGERMEQANRMINIPEGTIVKYEAAETPGVVQELDLKGAFAVAYRIGAMTTANLFADLPFGASIQEEGDEPG